MNITPFAKPMYVMLKPAGALCNLNCEYCYYLEKANLYEQKHKIMSDELLERFTKDYIQAQTGAEVLFTWHGGETLMRPISFFKKALEYQKKYAGGRLITNTLQTNGTMLTDEWCRFFKDNNFLIGISIDGPEEFHDEFRRTRSGKPSFKQVMRGINLLKKYGVEYNAMAVVNDFNGDYPLDFYHFFKEIECKFIQFAPIVERILDVPRKGLKLAMNTDGSEAAELADFSVSPKQYGDFLIAIFDEWVRQDVGEYYIQIFDSTLANWVGQQPSVCTLAKYCGHAGVMEFNGDVYSCDHFVFPEYYLGNIQTKTLVEMMYSQKQKKFGNDKFDSLPRQCKECSYLFACYGECPKNRFMTDRYGNPGLNYLCPGLYAFWDHVAPYMDYMKAALMDQRPPAGIMEVLRKDPQYFEKMR